MVDLVRTDPAQQVAESARVLWCVADGDDLPAGEDAPVRADCVHDSAPGAAQAGHPFGVLFFALQFTGNSRDSSNAASEKTGGNESGGFVASGTEHHSGERGSAADSGDRCSKAELLIRGCHRVERRRRKARELRLME